MPFPSAAYNVRIYSRPDASGKVGEVIVKNDVLMRLYDTVGKMDPVSRADKIAQRLTQIVAAGYDPYQLKVKYLSGSYHCVLGNGILFTVGRKEAQINQTTEDMLAVEWIERMRKILTDMPVAASVIPAPKISVPESAVQTPDIGLAAWFENDTEDFVAVHPSFPVGTKVRIKNLDNEWSIVVKITGNKNFQQGKIISVSRAAARALGIYQSGTGKVQLTVIN